VAGASFKSRIALAAPMAGRSTVFLVLMTVFALTMIAWANTVEVQPAPEDPKTRFIRSGAGDNLTIELTGWYGAEGATLVNPPKGFVFWSTQEEIHKNGQGGLPVGAMTPRFETSPLAVRLPTNLQDSAVIFSYLAGHKIGEPFQTPVIQPEDGFGAWRGNESFARNLQTFPFEFTLGKDNYPWFIFGVDTLAAYERLVTQSLGVKLEVGTKYACEGPSRWSCEVLKIDRTGNGTINVRRLVTLGSSFGLSDLYQNASPIGFNGTVKAVAGPNSASFTLQATPVVGNLFQMRGDVANAWPAGTYRVTAVTGDRFWADYSEETSSAPQLIGKPIWYDVVIVTIQKRQTAA
jgi:hypothetical protein